MGSVALSTLIQLLVVLVISFVTWSLFGRKRSGFRAYVGLTVTTPLALVLAFGLGLLSALVLLQFDGVRELAASDRSVVGAARRDFASAELMAVLALTAVIKTGLSEELLFRGLIGKRLNAGLGFWIGNTVQALLFGAVHLLVLLAPEASPAVALWMVAFSAVTGWVNGWLNERLGNGSILPGWMAHASANSLAYFALAGLIDVPFVRPP